MENEDFYPEQLSSSSKTSISHSIESYEKINIEIKEENEENEEKKYLICQKCKYATTIKFDTHMSNIKCNCSKIYNINLEYLKENFIENNKIEIKCNKHGKKYKGFCIDCIDNNYLNLCEDCIEAHKNIYKNHDLIEFSKAEEPIKKIKEILNDKKFKKKYINDYFQQIFKIINILIENYENSPCYNYYKSIKNAREYLCKLYHFKENKNYKIIKSIKDLYDYINKNLDTDLIHSIIILGDENAKEKEKPILDLECISTKLLSRNLL